MRIFFWKELQGIASLFRYSTKQGTVCQIVTGYYRQPRPTQIMNNQQSSDVLHGITLKTMLTQLVEEYGWEELANQVDIRCFIYDPSINSSLTFLRRTPWAREKVEQLYLNWKRCDSR